MSNETHPYVLSNWLAIVIFVVIMAALWVFGDLFTFLLGLLVEVIVFAGAYDRLHSHGH